MNRTIRWIPAWLVLGALVALSGTAAGISTSHLGPFGIPLEIDNNTLIDVNNIAMFVTNSGGFARDLESPGGPSGLYFPRGTDKTAVYACGLWFGAKVDDDIRVTIAEYGLEYQPGLIYDDGTWDDPADPRLKVYKVNKGETDSPDYLNWPVDDGAPVDGNGDPAILGDQMLWAVYNDADPEIHSNDAGNSIPLGIEVRQSTFAFARQGPLGNMIFVKLLITNRSQDTLEDCYVSLWSDPDLGGAGDDLVGCDTLLSLGYCYNDGQPDEIYPIPPAVGYDFFQGPIVPSPGDTAYVSGEAIPDYRNLPMTSFNKYINGTDPDSRTASYNYMTGLDRDGSPVVDPTTGEVTTFFHPGDPTLPSGDPNRGWVDENSADRRLMLSSGPFTMAPGDVQEVVVGIIVAQGDSYTDSINKLKSYDIQAQAVFDANFELPSPPPKPSLYVRPYDQEIDLIWSTDAVGDVQVSEALGEEYHHQGYHLWQGESIAGDEIGDWKLIGTWDVDDSVGLTYEYSEEGGAGGKELVISHAGTNSGLSHHFRVTQDYIRGGSLQNYREYFFAVTSYSYDVNHMEPVLVEGNQVGWVTPTLMRAPEGVSAVPKTSTGTLEGVAEHVTGASDGRVDIAYIDQSAILDTDYRITFRPNPDTESSDPFVWDVTDLGTGSVVLEGQSQQTDDLDDPVVNGFMASVVGPALALKDWDFVDGTRWISWVDWGGSGFEGAMGLGFEFFGSTLEAAQYSKEVHIQFSDNEADWSDCATYRRDQGYGYAGIGRFPGSAWDVTSDPARRLNICFVEMHTDEKPADLIWNPDNASDGGREYIFIMDSDYNGGTAYDDDNFGPESDVLMAGWPRLRGDHPWLESNGTWILVPNFINTEADVFEFHTSPPGVELGTVIDNDLKKIRVVPNPYKTSSAYELNQFDRIIKFINLPSATATIRIFTLGGELVRTIEKEDVASSVATWDLENEVGIPVASGVYIYHVDVEGIGTEVGKMVVFIEKERLNRF